MNRFAPSTSPSLQSPQSSPKPGRGGWGFLLGFCALLAILVFVLPWYFPGKTPTESVAWTYGFNNMVAVLGVGAMLAVMLAWFLWGGRLPGLFESVRHGILSLIPPGSRSHGKPANSNPSLRIAFIACSIVFTGGILAAFAYLPFAYFGESGYFLARLDWMVMGRVPYRDFVFNYGPLEVFFSYWIYWLGAGMISIEQAYATSLALQLLAGFYLIYFIVSELSWGPNGRPRRGHLQVSVFCVVAASAVNFSFGLSYTPLRFLIGVASLLWLHRTVPQAQGQRWEKLRIAAAAFIAPLICFAVSPEMGMAAWFGCICWFGFQWKDSRVNWGVAPALAALPATALVFSRGYFESMLSFGGGGYSFPIYPTAFILFFFLMVFSVSPTLAFGALAPAAGYGAASGEGTAFSKPQRALSAALCLVTGLPIVAALGRCDPGHIIFNGMGIAILFLAALARARSKLFVPALVSYFLVFVVGAHISSHYQEGIQRVVNVRRALESHPAQASSDAVFNGLRYSKRLPLAPSYRRLFDFPSIGIPLGCDEALERFLKMSGKLAFEYHMEPGMDVLNPRQLRRKFADMEKLPVILVPEIVLQPMGGIDLEVMAKADSEYLSGLMLFPVRLKPLNQPFDLTREIVGEIKRHYRPVCVVGTPPLTYTVLRREQR